jgi:hypothetical protein
VPVFNHPTFGDIQSHVYLEGKILKIYLEGDDVPEAKWDTADVEYENKKIFYNAPIRYHCTAVGIERANGAIADGGRGFDVDDKVILMAKIGSSPHLGEEYEKMYVVAHRDGVVPCAYNYLLIRMSASALLPHNPPYGTWLAGAYTPTTPNSHLHEYITVWDAAKGAPAKIYNPVTKVLYVFPVTVEEFKPAFDYYRFTDEELFTLESQGDMQSQEAGFVPDWLQDFQGNKIRAGATPDAWWTSYDIYANPIFSLLANTQIALATDNAGAGDGTFAKAMAKFNAGVENIVKWKTASPLAFNDQTLSFDVKGSDTTKEIPTATQTQLQELQVLIGKQNDLINALDSSKISRWTELSGMIPLTDPVLQAELVTLSKNSIIIQYLICKSIKDTAQLEVDSILGKSTFTPWEIAHDKNLKPLKGNSYHMQTVYGEDEIWVCGKNVYQGIVVSNCDAKWKFVRLASIPPAMAIGNPHLDKLAGGGIYFLGGAGASLGSGKLIEDVSFALASSITTENDDNLFSYGTLKRINDGGFHRTTHPALKTTGIGSWRLTQGKIPLTPTEPTFITAMNARSEHIDVWNRYDNWMNSIQYSAATYGVDRTWWFASNAQQWRIRANFIDTPIGSMWHASPVWEVALWYMTGFNILSGGPTCRRDAPLKTHFTRQTKHSKRVAVQVYIVQRQAVTQWDDPARTFVIQQINKGIYDHFAPADIKYVAVGGGANDDDYTTLTAEQQKALLSDRVYLRTQYPGEVGYNPPAALRNNRNEVEIMASCDLYSTLKTNFGRMHPNDQVRRGLLEYEIQKLITGYYTGEVLGLKDFSEFKLEARII